MFEIGGNTARLEFADGSALDGATVRVSLDMSVRDFLTLQRTIAGISTDATNLDGSAVDKWEQAYRMFGATALKSWDLTRDGEAVPATEEGFLSLPFAVANVIFTAWAQVLGGPGPNSLAVSASGDSLEAGPALMAVS